MLHMHFPQMMTNLDHVTVASTCSLVCKSWNRVSRDKLLWRALLARDFNKTELFLREAAGTDVSWISEYRRMVDEMPACLAQTLTSHDDEVLHVAFSHDGKQISSCSKDHHVIIWNYWDLGAEGGRFIEHYRLVKLNSIETS